MFPSRCWALRSGSLFTRLDAREKKLQICDQFADASSLIARRFHERLELGPRGN
jgi:hypothetical protein